MHPFTLSTLGHVNLTDASGHRVSTLLAQPKRLALLVYLAVEASHRFVRRETLCELFWPDAESERARASLRQALAFIRRTLGDTAIRTRGDDEVGIDAAVLRCDAALLRVGPITRELLGLYHGDFLRDFVVDEVPRFDRWVEDVRSGLVRDAGHAAMALAEREHSAATSVDDYRQAVSDARRATAILPFDESALVLLLHALSASGDGAGAEREYDRFVRELARELDAQPTAETVRAMERLRATGVRDGDFLDGDDVTRGGDAARGRDETRRDAALRGGDEARGNDSMRVGIARRPKSDYAWWLMVGVVASLAVFAIQQRDTSSTAGDERAADTSPLPSARRVLVAPFENQTGDAALDPFGRMVADWITEGFSRVDGLTVVPGTALMVMQRAKDLSITAMATETGATMIVSGSYYRTGGTLHVQARLTDATLAQLLRPAETVSVPVDSAMLAIARLRSRLMAAVAPLLDTTTHLRYASAPPSYEAYRDYLAGFSQFVDGDARAALTLFERAANADSTYHMPRLAAAIVQSNLGNTDTAFAQLIQLQRQRDAFGPVEQGTLDMVDGMLRGDLPLVYRAVSRVARITPGSINEYMVAETARRLNKPAEALGILRAMGAERGELRGWRAYWRELTYAQHMLGDFDGALISARAARELYPDDATIITAEIRALAALGQADSVVQTIERSRARGAGLERQIGALYRVAAEEMLSRIGSDASDSAAGRRADAMRLAEQAVLWYDAQRDVATRGGHVRTLLLLNRVSAAAALAAEMEPSPTVGTARRGAPVPSSLVDLGVSSRDEELRTRDLGVIAAQLGQREDAAAWESLLAQEQESLSVAQRGTRWAALHLDRAAIVAQLGDTERAITMLREATANGLAFWPGLLADPQLAPLQRHPAWASFTKPAG